MTPLQQLAQCWSLDTAEIKYLPFVRLCVCVCVVRAVHLHDTIAVFMQEDNLPGQNLEASPTLPTDSVQHAFQRHVHGSSIINMILETYCRWLLCVTARCSCGCLRSQQDVVVGCLRSQSKSRCCWLLKVTARCCWLLKVTARCCWLLKVTARCCWLLKITARCCWLLKVTARCCWLLKVTARCCWLLKVTARCCWLLKVTARCCWLLKVTARCCCCWLLKVTTR